MWLGTEDKIKKRFFIKPYSYKPSLTTNLVFILMSSNSISMTLLGPGYSD